MTSQTQAEQKVRKLRLRFQEIILNQRTDLTLINLEEELILLIQKADALDWLEKQSGHNILAEQGFTLNKWTDKSLLSAINQARKEQG